jgi:hypothetical protein
MTGDFIDIRNNENGAEVIRNRYTCFRFDGKTISGTDLTDIVNMPACYSETKRNIKKAWEELKRRFYDQTSMRIAINVLWENKIRMRSYYAMD